MKHRDMFKLLEGEDGYVVVVGDDDDDDDVTCCLPLRRRRTLLTPHHQSAQSGRESKRECFVVSLLHFQGSVSTFPTVEWRGGSKRLDMYSVRMGTWNLVEISRAMFVILRQRTF